MSYILDALRKSETERQQGRVPDLAQSVQMVHKPRRKRIPLAAWVSIGFFVNALVLAVIFWPGTGFLATAVDAKTGSASSANSSESSPSAQSPQTPSTDTEATSSVARTATDNGNVQGMPESTTASRSDQQTVQAQAAPATSQASDARQTPQSSSGAANAAHESGDVGVDYVAGANQREQQATLIVPDRSRGQRAAFPDNTSRRLPPETAEHLMEKSLAYQRRIPTLHFSSHIYASDPAARRVTINGHYLRVGDSFQGIRVEAINPDGVILSAYGESFRVGVVSDWVSPR